MPISHWWPGITPFNVWDLPYDMWLIYLDELKQIRDKLNESG